MAKLFVCMLPIPEWGSTLYSLSTPSLMAIDPQLSDSRYQKLIFAQKKESNFKNKVKYHRLDSHNYHVCLRRCLLYISTSIYVRFMHKYAIFANHSKMQLFIGIMPKGRIFHGIFAGSAFICPKT